MNLKEDAFSSLVKTLKEARKRHSKKKMIYYAALRGVGKGDLSDDHIYQAHEAYLRDLIHDISDEWGKRYGLPPLPRDTTETLFELSRRNPSPMPVPNTAPSALQIHCAFSLVLELKEQVLKYEPVLDVITSFRGFAECEGVPKKVRDEVRELLKILFSYLAPNTEAPAWNEPSLSGLQTRINLLAEYKVVLLKVSSIFKKCKQPGNRSLTLKESFPELKSYTIPPYPGQVALKILSIRHDSLKPDTIRKLLQQARRERKAILKKN